MSLMRWRVLIFLFCFGDVLGMLATDNFNLMTIGVLFVGGVALLFLFIIDPRRAL